MSTNNTRRLPIYLVLDTSGSMAGEPIQSVREGVKSLLSDLRGDPMALENAALSVITFASSASQAVPLTDLVAFQDPGEVLHAGGSTAMGDALRLLLDAIDREVVKSGPGVRGDYRPLIFLMTDGQPTDSWEAAAEAIKQRRPGNLIACAAGPGADTALLKRITETVLELKSVQPDQFKAFFRWVSASVRAATQSISGGAGNLSLPPPPPGVNVVI